MRQWLGRLPQYATQLLVQPLPRTNHIKKCLYKEFLLRIYKKNSLNELMEVPDWFAPTVATKQEADTQIEKKNTSSRVA